MAKRHLGETIDIHAGGQDLAFPHHENEIAQSEACNDVTFANYWMHNGYINIENEKMSKSLGNFVLVHDIIKEHDPQVIRFFMLSVHYRNPINFSEALLEGAKNSLERIKNAYQNLEHRKQSSTNLSDDNAEWLNKIEQFKERFVEEMNDDFNTANAISVLFDITKESNVYLQQTSHTSEEVITSFQEALTDLAGILGVQIAEQEELLDEEIEDLIQQRIDARKNRDFQRADQIRDELKEKNIILEDTAQGTRWKRG